MLIDTHAHLYWKDYKDDFDEVIQRSLDAGVTTIINVGVDVEKSKIALKQVQEELSKVPEFSAYSTIGIHPHEAIKYSQSGQMSSDRGTNVQENITEDIAELGQIYLNDTSKVVAVGECGLDYAFSTSEESKPTSEVFIIKNLQRQLFQAQIELAKKLDLPLIVHCRDDRSKDPQNSEAWDEVLRMVGNYPTILHCYSGLSHTTNYILQTTRSARGARRANLLISFAATITYPKNEYLREAAKVLSLEKIVLETDCPFLPPQSKRGQRNEPSNISEIAQLIAEIKNIPFEKVANQTTKNVKQIFKLN